MTGETPKTNAPENTANDWYRPNAEPDWGSLTEAREESRGDKLAVKEPEAIVAPEPKEVASPTKDTAEKPAEVSEKKETSTEKEKSFNERELDRIARLTGRVPDDPDVLKLNLVLRYQKFQQFKALHDDQKAKHIMIQSQTYEDIATAKRELEEAMYLYDESFKKADERVASLTEEQRRHDIKDKMRDDKHFGEGEATTGNSWVKARLERNKVYDGKRGEVENARDNSAEKLYSDLAKISGDIKEDEIFKTYELRKDEAPEEPISGRRDGLNAGKNGLFIVDKDGHMAPERPVDWTLYPHAPKSAETPAESSDEEGEGGAKGEGKGEKGEGDDSKDPNQAENGPDDLADERAKELELQKARELEKAKARELELQKAMETEIAGMSEAERNRDLDETEAKLKEAREKAAILGEIAGLTEEEMQAELEKTEAELDAKRARLKEIDDLLGDDAPLVAVNADFTQDKKDLAHDLAEQELNKEVAEAKGLSGVAKRLWKGTLFKKYFELKYTKEFESGDREIEVEGKKYGVDDLIAGRKDAALQRFVFGVVEENKSFIHEKAGESMSEADAETTKNIRTVIENFATAEIPEGHSLDELKLMFRNKMNALKGASRDKNDGTDPLLFDNYLEVAIRARERFEHGMAIEDVMQGFRVVNAEARDGIRTEAHRDALDRTINKLESGTLGRFIPAEALAAGIGIATALTQPGVRALAGAGVGIGASSILAGLKERNRVTEDRARMLRDIANGARYEGTSTDNPNSRTTRYEKRIGDTLYATERASVLTENIQKALATEGEGRGDAILRAIADARVRIDFSDSERKDLIAYTSEDKRGDERLALDIATIRAEKALSAEDKKKYEGIKAQIQKEIAADVDKNDSEFVRERRRIASGKAIKTLAIGSAIFLGSQEVMAAIDPTKIGVFEKYGILDKLKIPHQANIEGAEETLLARGFELGRGLNGVQSVAAESPIPVSENDPVQIERLRENGYVEVGRTNSVTTTRQTLSEVSPAASSHRILTQVEYANNGTNYSDGAELGLHIGRDSAYTSMAGMTSTMNGQSFDIDTLAAAGRIKGYVTVNGATFELSPTSFSNGNLTWGQNGIFTTANGDTFRLISEGGAPLYDSLMVAVDNGTDADGIHHIVSLATHLAGGGFKGTMTQAVENVETIPGEILFARGVVRSAANGVNMNGLAFAPITARTGLGEAHRNTTPAATSRPTPRPASLPESRAPSSAPEERAESAPAPAESTPSESAPETSASSTTPYEESDRYEEASSDREDGHLSEEQNALLNEILNDDTSEGVPPEVLEWVKEPNTVEKNRSEEEKNQRELMYGEWWSKQSEETRRAVGKFIGMIKKRDIINKPVTEFGNSFSIWMSGNHGGYVAR